jgi:hypothetical protein
VWLIVLNWGGNRLVDHACSPPDVVIAVASAATPLSLARKSLIR